MNSPNIDYVFWPASVCRYSFRENVEAAAAGGFTSLAVAPETYRRAISSGSSVAELRRMADDNGVKLRHLDSLTDWAPIRVPSEVSPELRERFDISADECFAICEALGLETILAVAGYDRGVISLDVLIDGFGRLCDRAAQSGLWVDLEFMPFWGLSDLAVAWAIIDGAQRENCGIMVDTWHFSKGTPDFELLRSLPGHRLVSVQVADAMKHQFGSNLFEDTVRFRKFPGEGQLPVVEILKILHQKGQLRHIGPEVFSDEADELSPAAAGKRSAESLGRVLEAAGIPPSGPELRSKTRGSSERRPA